MTSLTNILFNNPQSFVQTDDNYFATKGILMQSERSKCLYVVKNHIQLLLLTKIIKLKNSKIIHKDIDYADIKKYNFISYDQFKEYLIQRKDRYDIFDQIFIPINETKNVDLFLIIKILNSIRKDKISLSNVCYILRNDSIEASYDLKMNKNNTFVYNNNLKICINYNNQDKKNINYQIIEDIQNIKENDRNILIILDKAKDVQHMYYHLMKTLDKKNYFVNTIYNFNSRLNFLDRKDEDKVMIYVISSELTIRIPLNNIGYIFDSFIHNNHYISKDRANKYINYFTAPLFEEEEQQYYLTRYVSCEFFSNTYAYDIPDLKHNLFYYNFLILMDNSYDPISIFKNFIDIGTITKIFSTLTNLKIINQNKIIIDYKLLFSLDLYLRPSLLILKAYEEKQSVYAFIVLAAIINHSENGFFVHKKSCSGMIKHYLDAYIKYSKEIKSINPDTDVLNDWCDRENIKKDVFYNIISSIKKVCNIMSLQTKITLGLFDTDKLIQLAIPYLLEIYVGYVYKQIDKHMHHYSNDFTVIKIFNSESDYPDNIISFKNIKPNYKSGNMDTANFYIGFNLQ